ncbi:hypothetical protein [Proteiniclasticum sp.]|uniref:hypothetical protein n=1 Tax=Proteiniclasticum sp. TaxID=2053595 RepID=UPI0028A1FC03|nr:hypothetical protein [Proteiniclasticum sp.]
MKQHELLMIEMVEKQILKPHYKDYTIEEGDDPPDYLLTINNEKIALELTNISSLIEVNGELKNSIEFIIPLDSIIESLNDRFSSFLNPKYNLLLIIILPVINYRKFNLSIYKAVKNLLLTDYLVESEGSIIICDNYIRWKKVDNLSSIPRIRFMESFDDKHSVVVDNQITNMLIKSIKLKSKKMENLSSTYMSQKWLCLRSNYFLATKHDYSLAFDNLNIEHDFNKILIIDNDNEVIEYNFVQP